MYLATCGLTRRTMNALYSDLVIRNVKLVTNTPTPARSQVLKSEELVERKVFFFGPL